MAGKQQHDAARRHEADAPFEREDVGEIDGIVDGERHRFDRLAREAAYPDEQSC